MAVSFVSSDLENEGGGAALTIAGTGTDQLIFLVLTGRSGGVRTLSSATLGGVSASGIDSDGVDGGTAIMAGWGYIDEASSPGSGSQSITETWSGGADPADEIYVSMEFEGVDQTTPIIEVVTNTATSVADGGTISVSVSGRSGKAALMFIASTDTGASGGHTLPSGSTEAQQDYDTHNRVAVGYLLNIASDSETYNFTASGNGSSTMDSVVAGVAVIEPAAAGGTTITPNSGSTTYTGQDITLSVDVVLSPEDATFSVNGQDVDLSTNVAIAPSVDTFSIDGQDLTLAVDVTLNPEDGSYSILGQDVVVGGSSGITPGVGSLSIAGQDVTTEVDVEITPNTASFSIAGEDVTVSLLSGIVPETATLAIAGNEVALEAAVNLAIASATYSIAGATSPTLSIDALIVPGAASVVYQGRAVTVDAIFLTTESGLIVIPLIKDIVSDIVGDI
jgi:hypothetical protein